MAARGTRGLTDEQVDQLRAEVAAGRTPRVQITSAQLGGLTAGTVRAVGDPDGDGADYVTVRVKINGVTDDLRFAPRELSRGRATRATRTAPAAVPAPVVAVPAVSADVEVVEPPPVREPAPRRRSRRPVESVPAPVPAPDPAPAAKKPRKSSRRPSSTPPVTIAFTSVDASWTVSAHRGARPIVKAVTVNPGVVSALAAMLEVPAIDEAVAAVNDTARAEAELRAEQLRAELAELEAVLRSHRKPKN